MLSCRRVFMLGALLFASPAVTLASAPVTDVKAPAISVPGFRSAHFNMDEAAVRQAIKSDFALSGGAVQEETNPLQYTKALRITVPGLVPNAGPAEIDYVFGYKSNSLSEINITWRANSPGNSSDGLLHTGATLQNYFQGETFPPGDVSGNLLLANGSLLLFRGKDVAGHEVLLNLAGTNKQDATTHKTVLTPEVLTLVYASNPAHPDIFQLKPGAF